MTTTNIWLSTTHNTNIDLKTNICLTWYPKWLDYKILTTTQQRIYMATNPPPWLIQLIIIDYRLQIFWCIWPWLIWLNHDYKAGFLDSYIHKTDMKGKNDCLDVCWLLITLITTDLKPALKSISFWKKKKSNPPTPIPTTYYLPLTQPNPTLNPNPNPNPNLTLPFPYPHLTHPTNYLHLPTSTSIYLPAYLNQPIPQLTN